MVNIEPFFDDANMTYKPQNVCCKQWLSDVSTLQTHVGCLGSPLKQNSLITSYIYYICMYCMLFFNEMKKWTILRGSFSGVFNKSIQNIQLLYRSERT
jgi:hypothetical protein